MDQQLVLAGVRTLRADAFSASAPHDSDRWAASDRGWMYDDRHPNADAWDGNHPIGNYLEYSRSGGPNGETVHAVLTLWVLDTITGSYCYLPTESAWCASAELAQLWIERAYRARLESLRAQSV